MGGLYLAIAFSGYLAGMIASFTAPAPQEGKDIITSKISQVTGFLEVYHHLSYLIVIIALSLGVTRFAYKLSRKV